MASKKTSNYNVTLVRNSNASKSNVKSNVIKIRYCNKARNITIATVIVIFNIILRKYQNEKIRIATQLQM